MPAFGTEIGVTTEDIGPAARDRRHDPSLLGRQPTALSDGLAVFAEDVRDLEPASTRGSLVLERPAAVHRSLPDDHRFLGSEVIDGELRSGEVLRAQVCVELGRADRSVPQKQLNGPNICSELDKMRGEAVTQHVGGDALVDRHTTKRLAQALPNCIGGDVATDILAREKPWPMRAFAPIVVPQRVEKCFGEHDVAVLAAFPVAYLDDHALAVNVFGA